MADRDATIDRRLAGVVYTSGSGGGTWELRVDLPAAGTYNIRVALGDRSATSDEGHLNVYDDSTHKLAITPGFINIRKWYDATQTEYDDDTWPGSNQPVAVAFASTIAIFRIAGTAGGFTSLSHVEIEQVSGTVDPRNDGKVIFAPVGFS